MPKGSNIWFLVILSPWQAKYQLLMVLLLGHAVQLNRMVLSQQVVFLF